MNFLRFQYGQEPSFLGLFVYTGRPLQSHQIFCGCLRDIFLCFTNPMSVSQASWEAVLTPNWVLAHSYHSCSLESELLWEAWHLYSYNTAFIPLLTSEEDGVAHDMTSENPTPERFYSCLWGLWFLLYFIKCLVIQLWSFSTAMLKSIKLTELKVWSIIPQFITLCLTSIPHSISLGISAKLRLFSGLRLN